MRIFEGIGRVSDYTQLKNLKRDMRYRIRTGQSLKEALGAPQDPQSSQSRALQPARGESDATRAMRIRQKLRQGQKLSAVDMQYLKENDPDLYEKVSRIEERREELARALRRARTKDEALRAVTQANIAVLAEMKASGGASAPSLHSAMQGAAGGSAGTSAQAGIAAAPEDADELSADMTAEPSAAEMNAAIAGEALAKEDGADAAGTAAHGEASGSAAAEEERTEDEKTHAPGGRRPLTPEEKDELRRAAVNGAQLTPLDNEHIYLLRAYQREWMEYSHSNAYKELPDTPLDAAKEELRHQRRHRMHGGSSLQQGPAPSPAEILLAAQRYYHTAHGKDIFVARG